MSSQESTQENDPSILDYKDWPSNVKDEINSMIMDNLNKDLDKLYPDSINSYQINSNNQFIQLENQNKINDSVTLRLYSQNNINNLNSSPQNPLKPSIILPLYKVGQIPNDYILKYDFDPDFWKYFYPQNDPFFNYAYLEPLYQSKLTERNKENPEEIEIYEGQVNQSGEKDGLGKLKSKNKTLLGHWRKGQFTGWGREIDNNGDIYEGKFINGNLYGKGIFANKKNYYLGEFRNKRMCGFGEIFNDEFHYCGQLWDGVPNGKGKIHIYKEGTYEGDFANGEMEGNGILKLNNGNYYIGEMHKGEMHGYGKFVYTNGRIDEGYFRNGDFIKKTKGD